MIVTGLLSFFKVELEDPAISIMMVDYLAEKQERLKLALWEIADDDSVVRFRNFRVFYQIEMMMLPCRNILPSFLPWASKKCECLDVLRLLFMNLPGIMY